MLSIPRPTALLITLLAPMHIVAEWSDYTLHIGAATAVFGAVTGGCAGYGIGNNARYEDSLAQLWRIARRHYAYHPCIPDIHEAATSQAELTTDNAYRIHRCLTRNGSSVDAAINGLNKNKADFDYALEYAYHVTANYEDPKKETTFSRAHTAYKTLKKSNRMMKKHAPELRAYRRLHSSKFACYEQQLRHAIYKASSPEQKQQQLFTSLQKRYEHSPLYLAYAYDDVDAELQELREYLTDLKNCDSTQFLQEIYPQVQERIMLLQAIRDTLQSSTACAQQRQFAANEHRNKTATSDPKQEVIGQKSDSLQQEENKKTFWYRIAAVLRGVNTFLHVLNIFQVEQHKQKSAEQNKHTSKKQTQQNAHTNTTTGDEEPTHQLPFEPSAPPQEEVEEEQQTHSIYPNIPAYSTKK